MRCLLVKVFGVVTLKRGGPGFQKLFDLVANTATSVQDVFLVFWHSRRAWWIIVAGVEEQHPDPIFHVNLALYSYRRMYVGKKRDVSITAAGVASLNRQPLRIVTRFRRLGDVLHQRNHQLLPLRVPYRREAVVAPVAIPPCPNEAGFSQIGQVSRCGGLGDLQDIHKVANAQLSATQQRQNSQPRLVGHGREYGFNRDFSRRSYHIRLSKSKRPLCQCQRVSMHY